MYSQPSEKIHYKQDINIGYKLTNYKFQLDSLKYITLIMKIQTIKQ